MIVNLFNLCYIEYEREAFMKFIALSIVSFFIITYFGNWLGEMFCSLLTLAYAIGVYYLIFLGFRGFLRWVGRQLNHG
jgi:hypothetical protein